MLHSFQYERPKDLMALMAALKNLEASGRNYLLSSGGTDLMPQMKYECLQPEVLVSLSDIAELCEVSRLSPTRLKIGSRVTLSEFSSHAMIQNDFPGAAGAARKIASPQIQNRATVGGNLLVNNRCTYYNQSELNRSAHALCYKAGGKVCHMVPNAKLGKFPLCRARFVSDLVPVFLLCNAELQILTDTGVRRMALKDFYAADGIDRNHLKKGEVITHIEIEIRPGQKVGYEKMRIRNAIDFPSVGVALSLEKQSDWTVQASVTGVNTYPIYKTAKGLDLQIMVEQVSQECTKDAVPMRQDFFPPTYRKKMISVLIKQLFADLKGKI